MNHIITAKNALIATAAALVVAPVVAFAALNVGDNLGTDHDAIMKALEAAGYEDVELEMEDDILEAEAWDVAADMEVELEIDPATGEILSIETEGEEYAEGDEYGTEMAPEGDEMANEA